MQQNLPVKYYARAAETNKKTTPIRSRDLGSFLKIFHATKLIDDPFARGRPAYESVGPKNGWVAN